MKKAIVLGASGLVGGFLLELILEDNRYEEVITIGRKKLDIHHQKLTQVQGDLLDLHWASEWFKKGSDVFVCIGTTKAKTPDKENYFAIDFGIPVGAAKLAKAQQADNIAIVSAMGANAKSSIFYNATKGKMENAVAELNIENTYFMRPSLIVGARNEKRFGEKLAIALMVPLQFLIPKKYKPVHAKTIAKAMVKVVQKNHEKSIWLNNEILELGK